MLLQIVINWMFRAADTRGGISQSLLMGITRLACKNSRMRDGHQTHAPPPGFATGLTAF